MNKALLLTLLFGAFIIELSAQQFHREQATPSALELAIQPSKAISFYASPDQIRELLVNAPLEGTVSIQSSSSTLHLPLPDGTSMQFSFVESPIMAPELAAKFPEIHTYSGVSIEQPGITTRFDLTPAGFHAIIFGWDETVYIDPVSLSSNEHYIVYRRSAFYETNTQSFECEVGEKIKREPTKSPDGVRSMGIPTPQQMPSAATSGTQLRTYDLALACTGEYTAFHGGTSIGAMSAMTTTMNRVNGVYERDVAIRMTMVANNDWLIYLAAGTDPYTNNSGVTLLGENQVNCDAVIGNSNYDIGHVFSTGGGGVATLYSPCNATTKARGVTGQPAPVGDPFDIDYVCHEMGHQFGANHTQNNSCNRSAGAAFEPGSASTIMGYAGICSPNLQSNSDDHFHNHSYNEIIAFSVSGGGNSCPTTTSTGNTPPVVTVPAGGFSIPKSTPFELTASGSDVDASTLTYNWEEYDLGPATNGADIDLTMPSGNQPIFRSWPSSEDPTRVFPRLSDLVNNTSVIGELLPTYARTMTFRCTLRDNQANGGGVDDGELSFSVDGASGPFLVTYPNASTTLFANLNNTVTWDVAGTDGAPVNCAQVDIFLSIDGGLTYPYTLATNTPNDGSQSVLFPDIDESSCRLKIKASNNIFFDISNTNFSVVAPSANLDAAITNIAEPNGDYCDETFTPEITLTNLGTEPLISAMISFDLDGGTASTSAWSGYLNLGESTIITLPTFTTTDGGHTFNVSVGSPNGLVDENASNDALSSLFSAVEGGSVGSIQLTTDCYGGEVGIVLEDDLNNVLYDAPAGSFSSNTNYNIDFCLTEGCYELILSDTYGDGLNGSSDPGCSVDGSYGVVDQFGNILVTMGSPNYGFGISHVFCLEYGCTDIAACNYDSTAIYDDEACVYASDWYPDVDGDGFGDSTATPVSACVAPADHVSNADDCNDANAAAFPGAPATAEGIDNDCNGLVDMDEEAAGCLGDFNNDGFVNSTDLLALLAQFGCSSSCSLDITNDDEVNTSDLLGFLAVFGSSC